MIKQILINRADFTPIEKTVFFDLMNKAINKKVLRKTDLDKFTFHPKPYNKSFLYLILLKNEKNKKFLLKFNRELRAMKKEGLDKKIESMITRGLYSK